MLTNLISIPIMLIFSVIQTAAISRIPLLSGNADVILLTIICWKVSDDESNILFWGLVGGFFISLMTAFPTIAVLSIYIAVAGVSWFIHKLFWQSPMITVILSTVTATLVKFIIELITLQFIDIKFSVIESLNQVLFPNIVLNLFFIFPVYFLISDIAGWVSRDKEINV